MSGGTVVPRHECPGGHFFQGDSHASDTGIDAIVLLLVIGLFGCSDIRFKPCKARSCMFGVF